MPFKLDNVVPWGRSFDEYVRMFDLTKKDLASRIISCADGPASFNSNMTRRALNVISCDPIYQFTTDQLQTQIEKTYHRVMQETYQNRDNFVWDIIHSPEHLGQVRLSAMQEFLADYEEGKQQGRYLPESLPTLPFTDKTFDLAICSHFLFLYTKQLSLDFHIKSVLEMCRVAHEVRIFPLIDLDLNRSVYIDAVSTELSNADFAIEINTVPYEFQKGGNQMMKIRRRA